MIRKVRKREAADAD